MHDKAGSERPSGKKGAREGEEAFSHDGHDCSSCMHMQREECRERGKKIFRMKHLGQGEKEVKEQKKKKKISETIKCTSNRVRMYDIYMNDKCHTTAI